MTDLPAITIETAMAITDRRSKRTWMRRLEEGSVRRVGPDAGLQTRLALADVLPAAAIAFPPERHGLLVQASLGHAEAQAELGQLFCLAGREDLGAHWLQQAAGRGSADAMQWMAMLCAAGEGLARDEGQSLNWLQQAARLGHPIAIEQLRQLQAPGSAG